MAGDEIPNDTSMKPRHEIWEMAETAGAGQPSRVQKEYAKNYWVDDQFGALITYLKEKGIYDDTLVILQSDHGVPAKGM